MKIKLKQCCLLSLTAASCLTPICLTSCNLSKAIGEAYFEMYFKDWFNNLTTHENQNYLDDFDQKINPKIDCTKEDLAIMAFTYDFGGWSVWNKKLHLNNGTMSQDDQDTWFDTPFLVSDRKHPFDVKGVIDKGQAKIKGGDYKYLESALNKGRCGKITVYHGFEINELELLKQVSSLLQINDGQANSWSWQETEDYWKDLNNMENLRSANLANLKNQVLNYDGFCATSIDKSIGMWFLDQFNGASDFHNKIFYEIDVDENTFGGYVSSRYNLRYSRPLSWVSESQLLLSNKLKLFVCDANWINNMHGDNILYLKCKGYHNGI